MLRDETRFFLAADCDKAHWRENAGAFLETCRAMNVPAALERSRSGNGGHIRLFFDQAIPPPLRTRGAKANPIPLLDQGSRHVLPSNSFNSVSVGGLSPRPSSMRLGIGM
jgi:hypothetical protein